MVNAAMADLFTSYKMGKFNLSHRIVLAPVARCRASITNLPTPAMALHYGQRSTEGGLLIAEATSISDTAYGLPESPGIHTDEQVEAWKSVVDAVHAKGGIFFCQLYHVGRSTHQVFMPDGKAPISSTSKAISDYWKIMMPDRSLENYTQPRQLATSEIPEVVEDFRRAAVNAIRAGFDGVEIHGGHAYLIEQFLKDKVNDREDEYGGSVENRCKFLMEIVRATVEAIGIDRVGVRISPLFDYNDGLESDPQGLALAIIERLNKLQKVSGSKLAYLHFTQTRFLNSFKGSESSPTSPEEAQLFSLMRNAYEGTFMSSGVHTRKSGMEALGSGEADLIGYGRLFTSNPDLVHRFKIDGPLTDYDPAVFYTNDPVIGYNDYPFLDEKKEKSSDL